MGKILAVILLLIGFTFLYLGIFATSEAKDSKSWPSTTGSVIESKVNDNGNGTFSPLVFYEYKMGNTPYSSKRIHVDPDILASEAAAKTIADQYPTGSEVTVYYNSKSPEDAVLVRGGGGMNMKNVAVGAGATLLAIVGLIFSGAKPEAVQTEAAPEAVEPE